MLSWGKHYCPHYFDSPFSMQHKWIAAKFGTLIYERGKNVVVRGPRGSAKSTIATFLYPLYSVCEDLEEYIIFSADTAGQAAAYLKAIKLELTDNEKIMKDYPDAAGQGVLWNEGSIITANDIMIDAVGAMSKIRGRRYKQHRPSLIITDDPEGDAAAYSAKIRMRTFDWYTKGVLNAGGPKTNFAAIGSDVHRECLVAKLANMPGWEGRSFKSIIKWPIRMDLWQGWEDKLIDLADTDRKDTAQEFYRENKEAMHEGAQVLWPERFPLYELMQARSIMGHSAFESEHQGRPVDPSKVEWDPTLFEGDDIWFDEWPETPDVKVMAADPSKGKQDPTGDYQAIVYLAVSRGVLYIDADMQKRPIKEFVADIVSGTKWFMPSTCAIESNQFQETIVDEAEAQAAEAKLLAPIVPIENYGTPKIVRIRRLSPYVSRRRIKFKRRSRGVNILREQMMDFPNALHDDGPDALEMALREAITILSGIAGGSTDNPF